VILNKEADRTFLQSPSI